MKRLVVLLGCLFLLNSTPSFSQEIKLLDKFKDYQTKSKKTMRSYFIVNGLGYKSQGYDLDGDGLEEVVENYPCILYRGGIPALFSEYPCYYWFDLNCDNELDEDEVVIDEDMDGSNGNEQWLVPRIKPYEPKEMFSEIG